MSNGVADRKTLDIFKNSRLSFLTGIIFFPVNQLHLFYYGCYEFSLCQNICPNKKIGGLTVQFSGRTLTIIGTILPGPGALYLYQEINFIKPVWIDDTIEVKAKVIQKIESSKMVVLKINITNQNSEKILTGKERAVCPPN
jgi:hypothetical protein